MQHDEQDDQRDRGEDAEHGPEAGYAAQLHLLVSYADARARVPTATVFRDKLSLSNRSVSTVVITYAGVVPKLWNETIEAHRTAVREAILDTTAALVFEHGLASVTMSQIAEQSGIGRATLYKYFPDVESILTAWHARQITAHLAQLAQARDQAVGPSRRLETVLTAYASLSRQRHGTDLAALMHRGEHIARAERHLHDLVRDLLTEGARAGEVRDDIAPDELASYCLHALTAASALADLAAVQRLVTVTLAGLRPTHEPAAKPATAQTASRDVVRESSREHIGQGHPH